MKSRLFGTIQNCSSTDLVHFFVGALVHIQTYGKRAKHNFSIWQRWVLVWVTHTRSLQLAKV